MLSERDDSDSDTIHSSVWHKQSIWTNEHHCVNNSLCKHLCLRQNQHRSVLPLKLHRKDSGH